MKIDKSLRQTMDEHGEFIYIHNDNPILNTLAYNVEFQDGSIKRHGANIIAENISSQCNPDRFYTNVMEAILDHKRDGPAIPKSENY